MTRNQPAVLIVEDEQRLREAYEQVLAPSYDISTAATGADAIEAFSADLDIVLLDRRLPDICGDEVLRELQARNYDCYVAMVSAVDPDFDIIELGIDDYLVKPVSTREISDAVERLLSLAEYDETQQELSQKRVKRSVLAQEKPNAELQHSDEFARLETEIEQLEAELDDMAEELSGIERELTH